MSISFKFMNSKLLLLLSQLTNINIVFINVEGIIHLYIKYKQNQDFFYTNGLVIFAHTAVVASRWSNNKILYYIVINHHGPFCGFSII